MCRTISDRILKYLTSFKAPHYGTFIARALEFIKVHFDAFICNIDSSSDFKF